MNEAKRVVALDVGTKTIGVAATDPLGMLASPLVTLSRQGVKKDVAKLRTIFDERAAQAIVVGLPYELDGSEARSARLARQIGDEIIASTGLPVHYVDERFSSVEAERRLLESGMNRRKRQGMVDQMAAVIILESWMRMQGPGGGA